MVFGAVLCGAVRCGLVGYSDAVRRGAAWCSTMRCDAMPAAHRRLRSFVEAILVGVGGKVEGVTVAMYDGGVGV